MLVALLAVPALSPVPTQQLFAWQRAIAGMSAYCAATLVSSPVDVVKTRLQLQKQDSKARVLPLALSMLRHEGALVFFSGIGPALMMAPAAMVQYTLMDPLRDVLPLVVAAMIAGYLDITLKCPFDRLKTKLQGMREKTTTLTLLSNTWKESGVRGLWAGYGATLVRDLPYLVIKWICYTYMQSLLGVLFAQHAAWSNAKNLLAGAFAGAVAATAVTPADVVKTRLQARGSEKTNAVQIMRDLLAEGGVGALFSGLAPRLMRIPMYTAVTLATFDFVKDVFQAANLRAAIGAA